MIGTETLRALVSAGMSADQILAISEAMDRDAASGRPVVDEQAERRRAADRERKRDKRNLRNVCGMSADPPNDIYSNPPEITPDETIVSSTPKSTRSRKSTGMHPLPDGWEPVLTPAAQQIVDGWPPGWLEARVAEFRDHATDKGRKSKDWQAAFRTWITKADTWQTQDNRNGTRTRQPAVQQTADGLRGPRPDPAFDLLMQARAEIEAGSGEGEGGGGETWAALPSYLRN